MLRVNDGKFPQSELDGQLSVGCSSASLVEKRAKRFGGSQRLPLTRQAKVRPARASLQEAPLQQHGRRSERENGAVASSARRETLFQPLCPALPRFAPSPS